MIGATLTTRLAQDGIEKKSVTAFALAFLFYNLKVFWAPAIDRVRLPLIGRFGQRRSWLWLAAAAVMSTVGFLGSVDPATSLATVAAAAIAVGIAGATFDIVIDAYRIETLEPHQLGTGSGMSQYGWRIGSVAAGALALVVAARAGWSGAYLACTLFALPAAAASLWLGEPQRRRPPPPVRGLAGVVDAVIAPFAEFFARRGALLVLLFVLVHKIGDTLANLTLRLLLDDLGFSNDEIAAYDVGFGFVAYLVGIFVAGMLYVQLGLKRSLLLAPRADGREQRKLRAAGLGGTRQRTARRDHLLRELRERRGWRGGGGLPLGPVQPLVHRHAVRVAVGGGVRGRAPDHRHHRRGADRSPGLCRLLPADDAGGIAGHRDLSVDAARRPG